MQAAGTFPSNLRLLTVSIRLSSGASSIRSKDLHEPFSQRGATHTSLCACLRNYAKKQYIARARKAEERQGVVNSPLTVFQESFVPTPEKMSVKLRPPLRNHLGAKFH